MDRRHLNPITGCTKVSPGCDHCYAETFAERWRWRNTQAEPKHNFAPDSVIRTWTGYKINVA